MVPSTWYLAVNAGILGADGSKEARSSMLVYADCCDVLFPDVILEGSVSVAALGVCGLI